MTTKRLIISYGGNTLYDADVLAIDWSQDEDSVKVTGRTTPKRSADLASIKQKIKALQDINAAVQQRNGQPITEGATDG